jgi:hypothetical protein
MNSNDASHAGQQPNYLEQVLVDAESLLQFAAESGVPVTDVIRNDVLHARNAFKTGLNEPMAAKLLAAMTSLSYQLADVTPQSLQVCNTIDLKRRHPYRNTAIALAIVIVLVSTVSFVTSSIANSIREDINTANAMTVKLNSELIRKPVVPPASNGTSKTAAEDPATPTIFPEGLNPADVAKDLQQYAASIRNIDARARQLSFYVHPYRYIHDPGSMDFYNSIRNDPQKLKEAFELPVPLLNYKAAAEQCTRTYQRVRFLAQNLADDVSLYYGAVSSCILPTLYALLGAFAYVLRKFERDVLARTYVPSAADSPRFVVAAIGGAVVGLFSNLADGQAMKVSPLAFAFLVGYAVDVFYVFLERLIQSFTKATSPSSATQTSMANPARPVQ